LGRAEVLRRMPVPFSGRPKASLVLSLLLLLLLLLQVH
jgi:hypothetical protein